MIGNMNILNSENNKTGMHTYSYELLIERPLQGVGNNLHHDYRPIGLPGL